MAPRPRKTLPDLSVVAGELFREPSGFNFWQPSCGSALLWLVICSQITPGAGCLSNQLTGQNHGVACTPMLRVASVFLCIVGARVLAQSIENGVTSATELARDTTARRGLQNSQGCQSSVDNTNTEVTFGGRQFKVLPAASVSGYASSNDYNWHDVPEGWDVVTTTDDDWSDILSCVIASYRWSTHVLFVWDTSRDSYEAWGGADFTNGQWCCQWCYYDCSWAHADAYDEEGLPRRVRVSSYYGRVLIVSRPSAAPTREPTSYPTQFKFQSGWCSSDLDEYVGDASSVQDCWDKWI